MKRSVMPVFAECSARNPVLLDAHRDVRANFVPSRLVRDIHPALLGNGRDVQVAHALFQRIYVADHLQGGLQLLECGKGD